MRRDASIVSLGEVMTPLIDLPRVAAELRLGAVIVKDEGRLPTGSFKARGLALAVTMAQRVRRARNGDPDQRQRRRGNGGLRSRAGIATYAFCPDDTPDINVREIAAQGGKVYKVNGLIDDCGKLVAEGEKARGWFNCSTLKEPYRIEGKKTMGLELAEQLGWQLPDAIFYPTGGGTGLIGMWKAFAEMEALGWIGRAAPAHVCGAGRAAARRSCARSSRASSTRRAGKTRTRSRPASAFPARSAIF